MKKQDMNILNKIAQFPMGSVFSHKINYESPPGFGVITGIAENPRGDLVFKCRYASRPDNEVFINPVRVYPVNYDWVEEE